MTDKDKNESVEYILSQGLTKPPTFLERITKMFRVLGWRFIFWDLNYSLIFASVTLLGIAVLICFTSMDYHQSVAIGFSPMLFLTIVLFAEISERTCGLFELKQTCHYTSRQITALRCIFYSVAGVAFATIVTAFFTDSVVHFLKLLPLCLVGLFLCATIELLVIRLTRNNWGILVFPIAWIISNVALPSTFREKWEKFLSGLPLTFTITLALVCGLIFIYQINKMLTEENYYVIA